MDLTEKIVIKNAMVIDKYHLAKKIQSALSDLKFDLIIDTYHIVVRKEEPKEEIKN